ncbi:hypothetical protein MKC66_19975 [[Clostridium] innocuum]|nr:hypothetical protein [[Clostridium] innocuum]
MHKKIYVFFIILLLAAGCKQESSKGMVKTSASSLDIIYIDDTGRNNIIPVDVISKKEIKDLRVELTSNLGIDYDIDYKKINMTDKKPWFVWATENGYDWNKDISALGENDAKKRREHLEDQESFKNEFEKKAEKNELKNFHIYQIDIALTNGFIMNYQENEITQLKILDGDKELYSQSIHIKLLNNKNYRDDIDAINTSSLYAKTVASYKQKFRFEYAFTIKKDVTLKEIGEFRDDTTVSNLSIHVSNKNGDKDYKDIDPKNIHIQLHKGDEIIITPTFELKKARENLLFTRNYMMLITYEKDDTSYTEYFDSGVVQSNMNFEELYYFDEELDFSSYLNYQWEISQLP